MQILDNLLELSTEQTRRLHCKLQVLVQNAVEQPTECSWTRSNTTRSSHQRRNASPRHNLTLQQPAHDGAGEQRPLSSNSHEELVHHWIGERKVAQTCSTHDVVHRTIPTANVAKGCYRTLPRGSPSWDRREHTLEAIMTTTTP